MLLLSDIFGYATLSNSVQTLRGHCQQADGAEAGAKLKRPPPQPGLVEGFWRIVVEGDLVPSSHERRFLALQLFGLLLPSLGWGLPGFLIASGD